MTNRTIKSNGVTFVDMSDKRKLEIHISSNLPSVQIYDNNTNTYTPDWSKTNLTLEARVYLDSLDITNKITSFTWSGVGGTSSGTKYTIKTNILSPTTSIQTYSCEVTYDGLTARSEITFAMVSSGKNGNDGTSVNILGTYASLEALTSAHATGSIGDSYIIGEDLYVWCDECNDGNGMWKNVGRITGPAGKDGVDGQTSYFHVKYSAVANPTSSSQMTETPDVYIGTYVDFTQADSTDPTKYSWVRFQGAQGQDGAQGIPGTNGTNGLTSYLHIAYANSANGSSGFSVSDSLNKLYIGQYTDFTQTDSTDYTKYTWTKIKGDDGVDGTTYYTWIKYADTPTSGMSDSPDGKTYMGIAYNKTTATESTNYSDYTWALIKGANGVDGVNGRTYYTWVRYADDVNGTNMSDSPDGKYYIGLAYNKSTATESNTASDYQWSLFRGSDGIDGKNGTPASVVNITPSALYFKSTTGQNGTFTPEYIYLYPTFQTVSYSNWQYSTDGTEWKSVSGANGLTVGTYNSKANSLRISRTSTLYTDSITTISFRCNSNNSAIYDIVSIAKIYDVVDLQIGGRNLLKNTSSTYQNLSVSRYATALYDTINLIDYDLKVGDAITLSFWVKSQNGKKFRPRIDTTRADGTRISAHRNEDGAYVDTEGMLWLSIVIPEETVKMTLMADTNLTAETHTATTTEQYKMLQLERGNKPSDWSPAAEDIVAASSNTSVMLSNETHLFIANADGVPIEETVTLDVIGYQGATQKPTTVGTITGAVTGLTAAVNNNNTTNTKVAVKVTATLVQDNGILTIPVTVEGKTINKIFNWAKTRNGADGKPGDDAVTFKVFSENGYILSKDTQRITLQTFAYAGSIQITADATYQWYTVYNGVDTAIAGATGSSYDVVHSDITFRNVYKCVMEFGGTIYTDSVTIEDKNDLVTTFTTKPTSYSAGDIWVIGTDISASDMPVGVTYGEILKAEHANTTYSKEDWIPATRYDQILKELKDDVSKYDQFFSFDSSTGLNIKAVDANGNASQFSTTLSSDSLSFNQNNEAIASISGSKMNIKEAEIISPLTVTGKYSGNTMLQAPTINLGGFSLIIESNGSLSIISNN